MNDQFFYFLQVILAIFLGGVLGWQREIRGKAAGARTYALVTAGSTLFTILSAYVFEDADSSRVASQIVIGIGFLGAGTILHKERRVEGLTTAAGLWMAAAVGMAIGLRLYALAVFVTLLVLILLIFNEERFMKNGQNGTSGEPNRSE